MKISSTFSYIGVVAASLAASALLVAQPVFAQAAAQQKLNAAQSEVVFQFKQMGVPVDGKFTKFDAQVNFDAAKLATSKVNFTVDIASATLGDKATDAELPKAPWFNTAKFPQATFASGSIKSLGTGKFEVAGKLTIKGVAQEVVVPVAMTQAAGSGSGAAVVTTATGTFPMKRLTYKIGEGEWADTSMVADPVQVKFRLALTGVAKF